MKCCVFFATVLVLPVLLEVSWANDRPNRINSDTHEQQQPEIHRQCDNQLRRNYDREKHFARPNKWFIRILRTWELAYQSTVDPGQAFPASESCHSFFSLSGLRVLCGSFCLRDR